jgi:hypothetical protein
MGPKVTSLVARQVWAQHLHDTREPESTSYANFVRNICVTYAPCRFTPDARHIHESDANVACTCRATRDVTFGPLCISLSPYGLKVYWEKVRKCIFPPKKLMVPSDSAPQELSNERSCQYVSTILKFMGAISVSRAHGDRSHLQSLKICPKRGSFAYPYPPPWRRPFYFYIVSVGWDLLSRPGVLRHSVKLRTWRSLRTSDADGMTAFPPLLNGLWDAANLRKHVRICRFTYQQIFFDLFLLSFSFSGRAPNRSLAHSTGRHKRRHPLQLLMRRRLLGK